jgi:hypothetical protein
MSTQALWRKNVEDMPVSPMFFRKLFSTKLAKKEAAAQRRRSRA